MRWFPRAGRRSLTAIAAPLLAAPLLAASAGLALPGESAAAAVTRPVVTTDRGAVRGTTGGGMDSFFGIPYAAAPVGSRRWAPPQPAAAWTGVREATGYGSSCPVRAGNGALTGNENCLFLNIRRPSGLPAGARRPVFVFIHGGGLVSGSSNNIGLSPLVRTAGVVGVSFNYRLGFLGFLAHPALTARSGESGNYGLMDQQAVLRWVHRNIARFGGDPAQVTLAGESAGGWSVCAHLVSPGSRGLFQRAVLQSASCPSRSQATADRLGSSFAGAVHCTNPSTVLACLRAAPVSTVLRAPLPGQTLPVKGTSLLPRDPRAAVASGAFARVPVIVGANRDEGRTFSTGKIGWTRTQYTAWLRQSFGSVVAAKVLARYPWPAQATRFTPAYLAGAVITDAGLVERIGGCPNRRLTADLARYTRTWAYRFDDRTGPGLMRRPAGYVWGAGHAAELPYLFRNMTIGTTVLAPFSAADAGLSRQMQRYWGAFIRTGRPDVAGQPAWTDFGAARRVLSLRPAGQSQLLPDATLAAEHQCAFWDPLRG